MNRWRDVRLGDIAVIQSGSGFPIQHQGLNDQQYPFFKVSDMNLPGNGREMLTGSNSVSEQVRIQLGARVFPRGSIIFPKVGGAIATNKKRKVTQECCVDNNIMGLVPKAEYVIPDFLYLWLLGRDLLDFSNRANPPSISQSTIAERRLFLPSLQEQSRIVAILEEAFAGIDAAIINAEKNLANARELFDSSLNAVFSQTNELWVEQKLSSVCDKITVGHVGPMIGEYRESGIPFLRSKNIRPFNITLDDVVFIDEAFNTSLQKSALSPGDLVIVRTGYPGTAAVIPDDLPRANCSDLVIFRPGKQIDAHYLAMFFNSAYGKRMVGGNLNGAAQKHFNVTAAKEVAIPIPPLIEQNRLVAKLHQIRKQTSSLEQHYAEKRRILADLKQSILQKAFAGGLTAKEAERELAAV